MRSFVKKKFISVLCISVLTGMTESVMAQQDPQLSQFYAAPLFINPAMAGGSMMPRVMVNYRNQWPSLSANYSTALFSADYYLERFNSGVGLVTMNDSQGFGRLRTTTVALQYAYQIKFNEENSLRLGVEGSYINSGIDTKGLTFGDQFNSGASGGTRGFTNATNDPFVKQANLVNINYADVAGGLLYYNPKFWLGGAAHHLNGKRPNYIVDGKTIEMPRKYSVHGGMNFVLTNTAVTRYRRAENEDQDIVLTVAANYKKQGSAQQLDMGAYLVVQPITLGLWYRGIPIVPKTNDAVVALLGFKQDRFSVGYSYDLTVSGLGAGTGGAHEISIRYEFEPPDRYDRMRLKRRKQELSCPKF